MRIRLRSPKRATNDKKCPVCQSPFVLAEAKGRSREFYDWYISISPVWYAIRKWALLRAGNRCEQCGATSMLSVHHLTYNNLGKEHPEDLRVLCQTCHDKAHGIGEGWRI